MLEGLPEPSRERLLQSPLELVVCQVRHDRDSSAADPKKALKIRDALDGAYPVMDELAGMELTVTGNEKGLQSVQEESRRGGWKFQSPDGEWSVLVTPDSYALETNRYLDWDDFSERLGQLTRAVADQFDIAIEKRLGLRYIDRLSAPQVSSPRDWEPWIHPAMLGPILHPGFGSAVDTTLGMVKFDAGGGNQVVLRHGSLETPEGTSSYLLDHDCFREQATDFAAERIMEGAETLHTIALQVFQAAVSKEMFAYLRGTETP